MGEQQWCSFRVGGEGREKWFGRGNHRVTAIPALILEPGSVLQVLRGRKVFDEGKVIALGGHNNGDPAYQGLEKVLPSEPGQMTGLVGPLLPEWFEVGDVIRFATAPSKFWELYRAFPELWQRPRPREDKLDEDSIRALSQNFCGAWNSGNLELACEAYAEDATYVSKDHGVVRGKPSILGLYRSVFPENASMGKLTLEVLELRIKSVNGMPMSASAIFAWSLRMPNHRILSGFGLEVYAVREGRLKIIQDATM